MTYLYKKLVLLRHTVLMVFSRRETVEQNVSHMLCMACRFDIAWVPLGCVFSFSSYVTPCGVCVLPLRLAYSILRAPSAATTGSPYRWYHQSAATAMCQFHGYPAAVKSGRRPPAPAHTIVKWNRGNLTEPHAEN